jgi:hypothetical protein
MTFWVLVFAKTQKPRTYRVSHNTWDYKNALGRPLNDNIESWEVSQFEAKDHTCQVLMHGLFCYKLLKKPNYPKFG